MPTLYKNFAKSKVSTGYSAAATSIDLVSGGGAKMPDAPFYFVWWNSTDYTDPADDPYAEVCYCSAKVVNTLTILRAQEGTTATAKNTSGKTYRIVAGLTAATLANLPFKNNWSASSTPGVSDDTDAGYSVGSRWINTTTDKEYVCLDATAGAAVWTETTQTGSNPALNDVTDVTITSPSTNEVLTYNGSIWVNSASSAGDMVLASTQTNTGAKSFNSGTLKCNGATSGTITVNATAVAGTNTLTLPAATDTLVGKATTDTLTNKTLTSPVLNTGVSGTAILDEDTMASDSATQLATQQSIKAYVDTKAIKTKAITIESPTSSEDKTLFFTDVAITVTQLNAVCVGTTPSVTYTIRHDPDRSAAGNEVVTSGSTCTSTTTGDEVVAFNDATIPADSWVWLETTAQSGTVTDINVTVKYTLD